MHSDSKLPSSSWRHLLYILAADIFIKTAILFVDSNPRLFIGDSLSYLHTSLSGWIPPDRSFVYGFFIRVVAVWPHSLETLVWCQSGLSAISAWLVAVCLVRYFRTGVSVAAACSLLCAIEPLQLLAERYVLTETLATFVFALFALCCFGYLATERLLPLALVQLCGVLLISLRISFLPIVVVCSFALPLFTRQAIRRLSVTVAFGLIISQGLLFGYRHLYGDLIEPPMHGHPAYFYREGLFLVSDFAPILQPVDYPIANQRSDIFRPSRVPLARPENRDAQRWYPDGICDRILRECHGDEQAADNLARHTALRALKRNPLAAVRLGLETTGLYFYRPYFLETLRVDEGYDRTLDPPVEAALLQHFGIDFNAATNRLRQSPPITERWHYALYFWYWFLLLLPFLFVAYLLFYRRVTLPAHWLCAFFLFCFFEGAVVTVTRPTARFLTTMAWLAFIVLGACYSIYEASRRNAVRA